MARQRMVTRTIFLSHVTVLCMDTDTENAVRNVYEITGKISDEKALLKMIKKMTAETNIIPTRIISVEIEEKLYGMLETDFVKYANPVDSKEIADEN